MKRFYIIFKRNIQLPHLVMLAIISACIYWGFKGIANVAHQQNENLTLRSYAPNRQLPKSQYNRIFYQNMVKAALREYKSSIYSTDDLDIFLKENPEIQEKIPSLFIFNNISELASFLLWKDMPAEELTSFKYMLRKASKSHNNSSTEVYEISNETYSELYRTYFSPLYIASIQEAWKKGNYFKAQKVGDRLNKRHALLSFGPTDQLHKDMKEKNEQLVLTTLVSNYAEIYAKHPSFGDSIYHYVFSKDDAYLKLSKNYFPPIVNYLKGIDTYNKGDFNKAFILFNRVLQESIKNTTLEEYAFYQKSRCIFYKYKTAQKEEDKNKHKNHFINEATYACGNRIKIHQLRLDLESLLREVNQTTY